SSPLRKTDLFPRVRQPFAVFRLQEDQRLLRGAHSICHPGWQGGQTAVAEDHVTHVRARDVLVRSGLQLFARLDVVHAHLAFDMLPVITMSFLPRICSVGMLL